MRATTSSRSSTWSNGTARPPPSTASPSPYARGSVTAVLGPNGAGKTTTVECCEGYRRPDSGTVRVLGLDPVRDTERLRPRIGVMLQGGGIPQGVRAVEMLRHVARLHAHPLPVDMLVERLGLDVRRRTPYRRLSGGQQQRLSLALAVVGRPEVVFLDEPTAGLDPQARQATWQLVRDLRRDGASIVLTTHLHGRGRAAVRRGAWSSTPAGWWRRARRPS